MNEEKKEPFSRRRLARIEALFILYGREIANFDLSTAQKNYLNLTGLVSPEELDQENENESIPLLLTRKYRPDEFAIRLLNIISNHQDTIDSKLREVIRHWQLDRLSVIDRNILRLGVAELIYCNDIPSKVTINEYIEIAKLFSDHESPCFINGILDRIAKEMTRSIKR